MSKIVKNNFILVVVIGTLLYLLFSSILHIYIPCVFAEVTGLYCPGCGVTRMLKSMLELNFYQAFRYNPLLFIFFPFIMVIILDYIYSSFKNKKSLFDKIPKWLWNIFLVITLVYWVLRNIIPYLAPTVV